MVAHNFWLSFPAAHRLAVKLLVHSIGKISAYGSSLNRGINGRRTRTSKLRVLPMKVTGAKALNNLTFLLYSGSSDIAMKNVL